VKEGDYAQRISPVTEIWKGKYNDEVVALKILKVPRDDPHAQRTKSVSISYDISGRGLLVVVLTDNLAVLQGSGTDEADQARQPSPTPRGIDHCLRLLPGISLV